MMIEKTFEVNIWATSEVHLHGIYEGKIVPNLVPKSLDMTSVGYIRLGTGTLTANLIEPKDTLAEQVKSLEAQIRNTEADTQLTITKLRGQINNLLAICHDSGE